MDSKNTSVSYDTTSEQYLCPGVDRRSFYKQGFYDGRVPFHGRGVQAQGAGLKKINNRRCLNQLYTSLKQHFLQIDEKYRKC